tara:strand:- start:1559 stop:2116 length:558 start_codon:yes stop_codon:yes gene_type:complete
MPKEESFTYSEEEVEDWVQREKDWDEVKRWEQYILARRQSYFNERQRQLGNEYFGDVGQWDIIFEREWTVLEERLNSGIGVDESTYNEFSDNFFEMKKELLSELDEMTEEMDSESIENQTLTIYTFEDFVMLSNQGIFRDNIFILDPQRKWRKKVEETVKVYGYIHIERMQIRGVNYLVVSKEKY